MVIYNSSGGPAKSCAARKGARPCIRVGLSHSNFHTNLSIPTLTRLLPRLWNIKPENTNIDNHTLNPTAVLRTNTTFQSPPLHPANHPPNASPSPPLLFEPSDPHSYQPSLRRKTTEQPSSPLNQMHPRRRLHNPTHLPGLKRKRRVLKLLLHLAASEESPDARISIRIRIRLSTSRPSDFLAAFISRVSLV